MPININEISIDHLTPALVSQIAIKVAGTQVQEPVMARLAAAVVDQNVHLPGMFILRFHDPNLELLNNGPFDLTKEIEIIARSGNQEIPLIKGEITAIEPEFGEGMIAEYVIRGYDRSHRLFRETRSCAYLNTKDSDLANEIANRVGLTPEVETTTTVYDHIFQHNQTDLEFLVERAWRIGYECFVSEGKLYFRKPPTSGRSAELSWGEDLLSFHPRMTLAEQVDEVIVRGWDMQQQKAIVGKAQNGALYPQNGEQKDGAAWAHEFGAGKRVIVDHPVVSQAEADTMATARLNEISGAFILADGQTFRRPDVQAGRIVELKALGTRFSGKYLVTSAVHAYTPTGFQTNFKVTGLRSGLLAESMNAEDPVDRWPGVVIGVVTNNDDPDSLGRVKVKYPWMSDDAESDWIRVNSPGACSNKGFAMIPAVGDEVTVAFEQGEFNRPVVLGGLWNGQAAMPDEVKNAPSGEKDKVQSWHSVNHHIAMFDNSDDKIEIVTGKGRSITLSDKDSKITIKTSGVELVLDDSKMTIKTQSTIDYQSSGGTAIKSSGDLNLEANGNVNIKAGGNVVIQGGGNVDVNGSLINLNS